MYEHPFWWLFNMACVVWYGTITIYVAVRGVFEVRQMLVRLAEDQPSEDQGST